jgi:AcrR family transcriptional regulator
MSDAHTLRRQYRSTLRDQQAAATRAALVAAARELFLAQGYGATTIEQIAERAGVSKPTVFSAIGNKQAVMAALRTVALRGDDEAATAAKREPSQQVLAEPDSYRAVQLEVAHLADLWSRWAELKEVLRGAASSGEPALRELWATGEEQRLVASKRFVSALAAKAPLREGLGGQAAIDITWALTSPEHYQALVAERGWSRARYEHWLTDTLTHALLPPRPSTKRRATHRSPTRKRPQGRSAV